MDLFFYYLEYFNTLLWGYVATFLIITIGIYFCFKSRFMQIRSFPKIVRIFFGFFTKSERKHNADTRGTSPLKAFFASLGGCIGIGNLVTVAIAIQIGGPGALVWIWITALLGMILKYAEIFLGIKFRVHNHKNGYDGGPMYYLKKAFPKANWLPILVCLLLCIYGVEIFMFSVVKESIVVNWHLPSWVVVLGLLFLILIGVAGGVSRIGAISSFLVPAFVIIFLCMTIWVLIQNGAYFPTMLYDIICSAFTGHAAVGGFIGSTFIIVMAKGFSSAAYSGDVGIGYASITQSEARTKAPSEQASLSIFGIFLDTFVVCTCTVLLVYSTGVWQQGIEGEMMVQAALSLYFPYMHFFMPIFFFTLGYSTILPYMIAGIKAAQFISPRFGVKIYYLYAIFAFIFFSFFQPEYALTIMNIAGGFLMIINLCAFFKLRHVIDFTIT